MSSVVLQILRARIGQSSIAKYKIYLTALSDCTIPMALNGDYREKMVQGVEKHEKRAPQRGREGKSWQGLIINGSTSRVSFRCRSVLNDFETGPNKKFIFAR